MELYDRLIGLITDAWCISDILNPSTPSHISLCYSNVATAACFLKIKPAANAQNYAVYQLHMSLYFIS